MLFGLAMFRPRRDIRKDQWKQLPPIEVSQESKNAGEKLTVTATRQIGAAELGILLALISIGGMKNRQRVLDNTDPAFEALTQKLNVSGSSARAPHIMINTTSSEVIAQAGLAHGGSAYDALLEKLDNLSLVSYRSESLEGNQRRAKRPPGSNLLHYDLTEEGPLVITLSARLTRAIMGKPFRMVWLPDFRKLDGEVARIIFVRLCVMINPGCGARYPLDRFAELIYAERMLENSKISGPILSEQKRKDRRRALRKALKHLTETLPLWRIVIDRKGLICIERHCGNSGKLVKFTGQETLPWLG